MQDPKLWQRLARKKVNKERLAAEVIRQPEWLGQILSGLTAENPFQAGAATLSPTDLALAPFTKHVLRIPLHSDDPLSGARSLTVVDVALKAE